jgi:3-oxoadipate CoA-transferase alpha subunit
LKNKLFPSAQDAVADLKDGAVIMFSGFGDAGGAFDLMHALADRKLRDITVISNNCGANEIGLSVLFRERLVSRVYTSFPLQKTAYRFREAYDEGGIEVIVMPQGTLAERIRAAGAGIGGFFTPTAYGTELAEGKETRVINGKGYVLEEPLHADLALVRAEVADEQGNLRYHLAQRNFGPVMATAAKLVIAEVDRVVPNGQIHPDDVHTPGLFVDRMVVHVGDTL